MNFFYPVTVRCVVEPLQCITVNLISRHPTLPRYESLLLNHPSRSPWAQALERREWLWSARGRAAWQPSSAAWTRGCFLSALREWTRSGACGTTRSACAKVKAAWWSRPSWTRAKRWCASVTSPRHRSSPTSWTSSRWERWSGCAHSSGTVWESRWPSWAVRPNEPSGFRGRKELLNRASALVTTCP